ADAAEVRTRPVSPGPEGARRATAPRRRRLAARRRLLRPDVWPAPREERSPALSARQQLRLLRSLGLSLLAAHLGVVDRRLAARSRHRARAERLEPQALARPHRSDEPGRARPLQ